MFIIMGVCRVESFLPSWPGACLIANLLERTHACEQIYEILFSLHPHHSQTTGLCVAMRILVAVASATSAETIDEEARYACLCGVA